MSFFIHRRWSFKGSVGVFWWTVVVWVAQRGQYNFGRTKCGAVRSFQSIHVLCATISPTFSLLRLCTSTLSCSYELCFARLNQQYQCPTFSLLLLLLLACCYCCAAVFVAADVVPSTITTTSKTLTMSCRVFVRLSCVLLYWINNSLLLLACCCCAVMYVNTVVSCVCSIELCFALLNQQYQCPTFSLLLLACCFAAVLLLRHLNCFINWNSVLIQHWINNIMLPVLFIEFLSPTFSSSSFCSFLVHVSWRLNNRQLFIEFLSPTFSSSFFFSFLVHVSWPTDNYSLNFYLQPSAHPSVHSLFMLAGQQLIIEFLFMNGFRTIYSR